MTTHVHAWITKLNESNSRIHKETVISEALSSAKLGSKDAIDFLTCSWYAYNSFVTFNIKKVPELTQNLTETPDNDFGIFYNLLQRLDNRLVTGLAALSEIEQVMYGFDKDTWNLVCRPTILKDLRVGATIKTFNKILKKSAYEIPVFDVQLATDANKHPKKLKGEVILEPKLDGIRAIAFIIQQNNKTFIEMYTRNGKELLNFPHIEEQLKTIAPLIFKTTDGTHNYSKYVLDGEIISNTFQELMTQTNRKENVDTTDAIFSVFDIMPLKEFTSGKWTKPQHIRTSMLSMIAHEVSARCNNIRIVKGITVDLDTLEGRNIMNRFSKDQLALGYEGIMIKNLNAPYECKRSTSWLKLKPSITVDLKVIDIEEGTGKNANRLGALVCEGVDDDKLIKTNVGGGFTDDQRIEFWHNQDAVLNHLVEVKADCLTLNANETDIWSLRFPVFLRFRDIDVGEKI